MERKKKRYEHKNVVLARNLRKNMTPEERRLWYDFLRDYPIRFKRQCEIGCYIADFYCPRAKLVVELDGRQHYTESGLESDKERTSYLNRYGIRVLRFKNRQIRDNFQAVCEHIDLLIATYVDDLHQEL